MTGASLRTVSAIYGTVYGSYGYMIIKGATVEAIAPNVSEGSGIESYGILLGNADSKSVMLKNDLQNNDYIYPNLTARGGTAAVCAREVKNSGELPCDGMASTNYDGTDAVKVSGNSYNVRDYKYFTTIKD